MTDVIKKVGSYKLIRKIGKGATSLVFEGRKEGEIQKYAIKMIQLKGLTPTQRNMISKQISIIKNIQHPNIVELHDTLETSNNYYLIFEFCEKGDLENYLKDYYGPLIPEEVVQRIIYCLADALSFVHAKGIVHRDIKLANILLKKDFTIKLADFGFAKDVSQGNPLLKTYCGTPITMAPQILENKEYDMKCDVWSLGIILFQLVYGKLPFSIKQGYNHFADSVINAPLKIPTHPQMPPQFKQLLTKALEKNPKNRLSSEEFMKSEWVELGSDRKLEEKKKQKIESVSDMLRNMSGEYKLPEGEKSTKQGTYQLEEVIALRIQDILCEEISKMLKSHVKNRQEIQELLPKDEETLKGLLTFLDFKYLWFFENMVVKLVKEGSEQAIELKDVPQLELPKPFIPQQPKAHKAGQILFDYLKKLSTVQMELQKRKIRYQIVIKLLKLIRRYQISISIIFSHHFYQEFSLKSIRQQIKSFEIRSQQKTYHKNANFITIAMQCKEKDENMKECREAIENSCLKRLNEIQKEINGYY